MASSKTLCPVTFTVKVKEESVFLIGSWTEWKQMIKKETSFEYVEMLPPGFYEYRYIVNGSWYTDARAPVSLGEKQNNCVLVKARILCRLQGMRTKLGPPFSFRVNPDDPLQRTIQRAMQTCGIDDDARPYELLRPIRNRPVRNRRRRSLENLLTILCSSDIADDDLLYLELAEEILADSSNEDDTPSSSSSSSSSSGIEVESAANELATVELYRTDTNVLVYTGKSLQDAQDWASQNKSSLTGPLRVNLKIPAQIHKFRLCL